MLAIFLDVHNEVGEVARECDIMKRKLARFNSVTDPEDRDSHLRAIAGCIHGVYTGVEKLLKSIVRYFDGEIPTGEDWHIQLLLRVRNPNEGVRPRIVSESTYRSPNTLRGFRHIFRSTYHTNLIPELTVARADEMLKTFDSFVEDLRRFESAVMRSEGEPPQAAGL
jgi:hypothetical protein